MKTSTCYVKRALREFKGDWMRVPVSDIPAGVAGIDADRFRKGQDALYVGVKVRQEGAGESGQPVRGKESI